MRCEHSRRDTHGLTPIDRGLVACWAPDLGDPRWIPDFFGAIHAPLGSVPRG